MYTVGAQSGIGVPEILPSLKNTASSAGVGSGSFGLMSGSGLTFTVAASAVTDLAVDSAAVVEMVDGTVEALTIGVVTAVVTRVTVNLEELVPVFMLTAAGGCSGTCIGDGLAVIRRGLVVVCVACTCLTLVPRTAAWLWPTAALDGAVDGLVVTAVTRPEGVNVFFFFQHLPLPSLFVT